MVCWSSRGISMPTSNPERKAVVDRWFDVMDARGDPPMTTVCAYLSSVPTLLLSLPTPSTKSGLKTSWPTKTSPQTVSGSSWTTLLLGGPICRGSTRQGSLGGAKQLHPSADHHLVWSVVNIWNPTSGQTYKQQRQKRSVRTSHSRLDVPGLRDLQLARMLATLDLSSMTWSDATQKLFHQGRMALGFQRCKMAYWAYDFKEEVEEIVAERKAAENSVEARRVARRKFAYLKDQWWNKQAERVERAAEIGDSRLQY